MVISLSLKTSVKQDSSHPKPKNCIAIHDCTKQEWQTEMPLPCVASTFEELKNLTPLEKSPRDGANIAQNRSKSDQNWSFLLEIAQRQPLKQAPKSIFVPILAVRALNTTIPILAEIPFNTFDMP